MLFGWQGHQEGMNGGPRLCCVWVGVDGIPESRGMQGAAACHLGRLSALWGDRAVPGRETVGLSTMT